VTDQLEAIRKRHEAIVPGPWRWFGNTETDQLYLGTVDRGRLYVLTVGTREEQYVYHHANVASYTLSEISNTRVQDWCGGHDEFGGHDADGCICLDIADFLRGEVEREEGARHFSHDRRPHSGTILTRGVSVHADLRFAQPYKTDPQERKTHGGVMRSYRDCGPKYEVLGYRSVSEWEMDQGGVQNARDALYRQDFMGFDQPEATFIEHAPEDIAYLLGEIDRLRAELEARQ
jgi:hypothetical protein